MAADPFASWLTLRGLKTLALRMERHRASAAILARRLDQYPAVTTVHWPGLPGHPDHPASTSHRQLGQAGLAGAGISPGTVRVSVGLEHPDDIWADFEQALAR